MLITTKVYPIYENITDCGYEYGFVVGNRDARDSLFANAGVIKKTYAKKQKFRFLVPTEATFGVDIEDDYVSKLNGSVTVPVKKYDEFSLEEEENK